MTAGFQRRLSVGVRTIVAGAIFVCTAVYFEPQVAAAADSEFVGVLALALEKDVAEQLQLSDEQRAKLLKLVERREEEVLELALELRNAEPAERAAKLDPFRKASEAEGLKLLDVRQRAALETIRIRRAGGASLGEAAIAEQLKLSDEQKTALDKILAERGEQLSRTSGSARDVLRGAFEQRLFGVLDREQRSRWDELAGVTTVAAAVVQTPATPNAAPAVEAATPAKHGNDVKLKFSFRFQPWEDVLHWFAEQADLSLLMDAPPPGTLNYTDSRSYTPAEALDLMNGVLLTKGYTLVRRERMLHVINLEDGIPPNLVSYVPVERLDSLGEYELVTTLFSLGNVPPEDAEAELKRLIGPQGSVVVLPRARQIQATETAGRLRLMRSVLLAAAQLQSAGTGDLRAFQPTHVALDDALPLLRQLLDIGPDAYASTDGSIRLALDPVTGKLLVSGKPEKVQQAAEIMEAIDVPAPEGAGGGVVETPQLEVYDVGPSDAGSVLAVLQTLLAVHSDVRLTTDPQTGKLIALARPEQHATIRAVLAQMQREARQIEVLRLQFTEPSSAVVAINRLFGGTGETPAPGAPKVEADASARQIIVRGSPSQITQIRDLLVKMGENVTAEAQAAVDSSNVRMLPLGSRSVRTALDQMQAIWPTLRDNKIRIVEPSAGIPSIHPGQVPPPKPSVPVQQPAPSTNPGLPPGEKKPPIEKPIPAAPPAAAKAPEKSAARPITIRTMALEREVDAPPAKPTGEAAEIIVVPGATGVMIASDDIEALNQFEALLNNLASRQMTGGREFTVFYLENASATTAAETLESVFGGGGSSAGGGSLMGDLASMALGNVGGNLLGAMMGGGGGAPAAIVSSSSVLIVPDSRLNALIVQAAPADLDLIEQLLRVIDRQDVPESTVNPRPRIIPVRNTSAAQIADVVREIYQDRLVSANRQRQPSPEEFVQMLRGGGGGGRGGSSSGRGKTAEPQKVSISVDARTNSLVVAAAEPMFTEIEMLVQTLDHATSETNQAIRVVSLKQGNVTTVQKALTAIVGEKARTSSDKSTTSSGGGDSSGGGSQVPAVFQLPQGGGTPDGKQMQDLMRQRMEMFNQMRGGGGGGPGGPGGGRGR